MAEKNYPRNPRTKGLTIPPNDKGRHEIADQLKLMELEEIEDSSSPVRPTRRSVVQRLTNWFKGIES